MKDQSQDQMMNSNHKYSPILLFDRDSNAQSEPQLLNPSRHLQSASDRGQPLQHDLRLTPDTILRKSAFWDDTRTRLAKRANSRTRTHSAHRRHLNRHYSPLDLDSLFCFLLAWYSGFADAQKYYDRLNLNSLILVGLNFQRLYRLPYEREPASFDSYEQFCEYFSQLRTRRSKQEQVDLVYKHALRGLESIFGFQSTSFILGHSSPRYRDYLKHRKSTFYLHLFESTITGGRIHEDLAMDILHERVTARKPGVGQEANWKQSGKKYTVKKVSTSVRYLIKQDPMARRKVLEFIGYANDTGLVTAMRTSVRKKLESKKAYWIRVLSRCDFDFERFKNEYLNRIRMRSYKLPWTLREVKRAVDLCVAELEDPDDTKLKTEFLRIRHGHYTSKRLKSR